MQDHLGNDTLIGVMFIQRDRGNSGRYWGEKRTLRGHRKLVVHDPFRHFSRIACCVAQLAINQQSPLGASANADPVAGRRLTSCSCYPHLGVNAVFSAPLMSPPPFKLIWLFP